MPEYYRVGPAIWNKARTDDQRLMAFYMLTNAHRNTEGLYRLPLTFVVEDMGWPIGRVRTGIVDLEAEDFLNYDYCAKVVLIVNALRWQAPDNPSAAKAAVRRLESVPETLLRARFVDLARRNSGQLIKALEKWAPDWCSSTVSAPVQTPSPNGCPDDQVTPSKTPNNSPHLISTQLHGPSGGDPQ